MTTLVQNANNNTLYGFTKGDIAVADSNGKIQRLQAGPDGSVLAYNSSSPLGLLATAEAAPFTNSVASGATGATSFPVDSLLVGNGTDPLKAYKLTAIDSTIAFLFDDSTSTIYATAPYSYNFKSTSDDDVKGAIAPLSQQNYYLVDVSNSPADSISSVPYAKFQLSCSLKDKTLSPKLAVVGAGVCPWQILVQQNTTVKIGDQTIVGASDGSTTYLSSSNPTDAVELVHILTQTNADGSQITNALYVAHVTQGNIIIHQ